MNQRLIPWLFATTVVLGCSVGTTLSPNYKSPARNLSLDPWAGEWIAPAALQGEVQSVTQRKNELSITHESYELDTATVETLDFFGNTDGGEVDIPDVDQTTTHLDWRRGGRSIAFTVGLQVQEFNDDTDLYGVRLGCDGLACFGSEEPVGFGVDYNAALGIMFGDTDSLDTVGAELAARAGLGVVLAGGLQLSAGGALQSISMEVETPGDSSETFTIDATNSGAYLRAWFRSNDSPIVGGLQANFGDLDGFVAGFGLRF